jgi:hypothetical protein
MARHRMAGCRQCSLPDTCIQPIPMDIKCLGQPEHRPLPLALDLGLTGLGERELPTGPTELPNERHRDAITPGGAQAFRRYAPGNLTRLVADGPQRQHPRHNIFIAADLRLPQHGGMHLEWRDGPAPPDDWGLACIGDRARHHDASEQAAHQFLVLGWCEVSLGPQRRQRASQLLSLGTQVGSELGNGGTTRELCGCFTRVRHRLSRYLPTTLPLGRSPPMVWIHGLIWPLRQTSLVRRSGHLIRLVVGHAGMVRPLCGQHLLEQIPCGRSQRRTKRLDDDPLPARPLDVPAGRCRLAGSQGGPGRPAPAPWFVDHPHLGAATAAAHQARQKGLAMAWGPTCPPGQRARMIHQAGLMRQQLLPTAGGRLPVLMDGRPGIPRPADWAALPRSTLGGRTATPRDQGPRVGRVVQDLRQGRLCRFAPQALPRLPAAVLAPWAQTPVSAAAAQDLRATAEVGEPGEDAVERLLPLEGGVFHNPAVGPTDQARGERLAVGAPLTLALTSGLPP